MSNPGNRFDLPAGQPACRPQSPIDSARVQGRDSAGLVLGAAAITTGLIAGTYSAFSFAVMPGLAESGDRTFVEAMQKINVAIENPAFFAGFFGALAFPPVAALMLTRRDEKQAALWTWAGLALYAVGLITTITINVPLNDDLAATHLGNAAQLATARDHFESAWVFWNAFRAVLSTAALGCLGRAHILHGRRR
jgi:uncharacterized membrane protein